MSEPPPFAPPPGVPELRARVRALVAEHESGWDPVRRANSWTTPDPGFSRALGAARLLGMTWPEAHGGHAAHPLHRYVVLEELLVAGAPVGAHWIADRQTGPLLLRYGTPEQQARYLPGMARGELYACIGLSEPGAGSDLAAVRTTTRRTATGWVLDGQKLWTTGAGHAHVMLALVRSEAGSERHAGLSQLLVDLTLPGVTIRPIVDLAGDAEFNEVFFDAVDLPAEALVGTEGAGWAQVTAELSLERSGPERYLSSFALLRAALAMDDPGLAPVLGELVSELWTLRRMSMEVAARLASGEDPVVEAAIVKDLGNAFEQRLPVALQAALRPGFDPEAPTDLARLLRHLLLVAPSFSLRGGTAEIIRGIVARGLGLR